MINIYRKVEKSESNLQGIEEVMVEDISKPILLCISAQDNMDKSIYGSIRQGMEGARLCTTSGVGAGYKLDGFPVDFLGVRFIKDEEYKHNYEEIADKLIYPLIKKGVTDVESMISNARRINIMTYCDGTLTYRNVEKRIIEKLQQEGLSSTDIDRIVSEIGVAAIGTEIRTDDLLATVTTFIDVNDTEIFTSNTPYFQELIKTQERQSVYGTTKRQNNLIYIYNGKGFHSLKEYFKDDVIVTPAVVSVISKLLERSIKGVHITGDDLINRLDTYAIEDKNPKELLSNIDDNLDYGAAERYSRDAALLHVSLDNCYKNRAKELEKAKREEAAKSALSDKLNTLSKTIGRYCSDVTFYQIMVSAKLFQAPAGRDVFSELSDREVRDLYMEQVKEEGNGIKL